MAEGGSGSGSGSQTLTGTPKLEGEAKDAKLFSTIRAEDQDLVRELNQHGVKFVGVIETTFWRDVLSWILPAAIFGPIWYFFIRRLGQAQGGFMPRPTLKSPSTMSPERRRNCAR